MSQVGMVENLRADIDQLPRMPRTKRNIVLFTCATPVAINLDHVSVIRIEGNIIYFDFYTKTQSVDMADEETAKAALQKLVDMWAGDVVE